MATFQDVILGIPGLTHYYPLNSDANDIVGDAHGIVHGNVEFDGTHAVFDGDSDIELPDRNEFSAAGNSSKELSIAVFQIIDDWTERSDNNEYVHWMGKGKSGAHEWTFRYYCDGCGGEAPERKRRTSYYNFNKDGGLGTGSYFQDEGDGNGTERVITGMIWGDAGNGGKTQMWKNGALRDTDNLSDYDVYPTNTGTPVFLGSRGDGTGNLVGRLRRVAFFNRKLTEAEIKSLYDARTYEEGSGGSTGGGGGGTPPPVEQTAEILINGETFPLSGLNTARGAGTLVAYTKAFGPVTTTNEWGAEIKVEHGFVTEILDQQEAGIGDHNLALDDGYVLSGHGDARLFLLDNAVIGERAGFTDIVLTPPPPITGGGGDGETDLTAVKAAYDAAEAALTALNGKMDILGTAIDEAG